MPHVTRCRSLKPDALLAGAPKRALIIACFAAALAMAGVPAPGHGAGAPPEPAVSPPALRDSIGDLVTGVWISDAAPKGLIMISTLSAGRILLDADGRFRSVGFFDGRQIVALTSTTGREGAPAGLGSTGILRAVLRDGSRIDVEFADDLKGPTTSREVWKLHRRFDSPPRHEIPEPPSERSPNPGEYVYVEELPEAVEKVPPHYPTWAREKNISGTVLIQALVGKDGRVKDTKVVRSIPELDDHAVAAVKQWRFKPAQSKGAPVAVWIAIPVRFTLN